MTGRKTNPTNGIPDEGLTLVTSHDAKYRLAADVFRPEVTLKQVHVNVPEIQLTEPDTVARQKAKAAYTHPLSLQSRLLKAVCSL